MIMLVFNLYLLKASIISNEMDKALKIATEQTQDKMKEIIYQRNLNNDIYFNDEEYRQYFTQCFNSLVKDPEIYKLNISADNSHGILTIKARTNNSFVKKRAFTNIVDIKLEEVSDSKEEIKIPNFYGDAHSDNIIYQKEFENAKTIAHLNIYAISYMNSDESHYYDCSPQIDIYFDDVLIKSFEHIKYREMRNFKLNEGISTKKIKIVTKALDWDYYDRKQVLIAGNSKIGILSKQSTYKIDSRYIDDENTVDTNSVWRKEEYHQVLINHLNLLHERNN